MNYFKMKHFLLSLTEIVTPLIYRIYVLQSYLKFFLLRLAHPPSVAAENCLVFCSLQKVQMEP